MALLRKTFQSKDGKEEVTIECDYTHDQSDTPSMSDVSVTLKTRHIVEFEFDLTSLFDQSPFTEMIDSINWEEMYIDFLDELQNP